MRVRKFAGVAALALAGFAAPLAGPFAGSVPAWAADSDTSQVVEGDADGVVSQWFSQSGPGEVRAHASDVFPKLTSEQVTALTIGTPLQASGFVNSVSSLDTELTNYWVAPLLLGSDFIGTIAVDFSSGSASTAEFTDSESLAAELINRTPSTVLTYDSVTNAWYLVRDRATVVALDTRASDTLAGSVTMAEFRMVRDALVAAPPSSKKSASERSEASSSHTVRYAIVALASFLMVTGVVVFLRRDVEGHAAAENPDEEDSAPARGTRERPGAPRIIRSLTGERVTVIDTPVKDELPVDAEGEQQ